MGRTGGDSGREQEKGDAWGSADDLERKTETDKERKEKEM